MANKLKLPWAVKDGHVVTCDGLNDAVAFNVGNERAGLIVTAVNERDAMLEELDRYENTPPTWAELDNLKDEIERLEATIEWYKKRDDFLLSQLDRYVRCACGSKVPKTRLTWAHPTCYKCLAPPPPLEVIPLGEEDLIEESQNEG